MKQPLILCVLVALTGCTSFVTDLSVSKDGMRTTHTRIATFFDGKSAITKQHTTNSEKSQSAGLGTIDNESSGTNTVTLVETAARSFGQGLIQGAK